MKLKIRVRYKIHTKAKGCSNAEIIREGGAKIYPQILNGATTKVFLNGLRTKVDTYGKFYGGHLYKCPLCGHVMPFSKKVTPAPEDFQCEKCHMPLHDEDMCAKHICSCCGKPIEKGIVILNLRSTFCRYSCLQKVWDFRNLVALNDDDPVPTKPGRDVCLKIGNLDDIIEHDTKAWQRTLYFDGGYVYVALPRPREDGNS